MFFRKKKSFTFTPLEIEQQEQSFYINFLRPGMIAFDVGGNRGEITLLFSHFVSKNGWVHSFEPTPQTFDTLKQVITLFSKSNVVLNNQAIASHIGEMDFYIYPDKFSSWNTFAKRPLEQYGIDTPSQKITIETNTIDNYCREHGIDKIDLLKIDVEGAELDVLIGAEKMFSEKKIACCVFEFGQTTYDMGHSPQAIQSFFDKIHYSVKNLIKGMPTFPHNPRNNQAKFSLCIAQPR